MNRPEKIPRPARRRLARRNRIQKEARREIVRAVVKMGGGRKQTSKGPAARDKTRLRTKAAGRRRALAMEPIAARQV